MPVGNGRWKVGRSGQPEWEALPEGVSVPNQIDPPEDFSELPGDLLPGMTMAPEQDQDQGQEQDQEQDQAPFSFSGPSDVSFMDVDPGIGTQSVFPSPPPMQPTGNGRWKIGRSGQPEWEALPEGVWLPNQIDPPEEEPEEDFSDTPPVRIVQAPYNAEPVARTLFQDAGEAGSGDRLEPAPAGFDPQKWADPGHQSPKYVAGRLAAQGASIEEIAQALGASVVDEDEIYAPELGQFDVFRDVEGARAPQWGEVFGVGEEDIDRSRGAADGSRSAGPQLPPIGSLSPPEGPLGLGALIDPDATQGPGMAGNVGQDLLSQAVTNTLLDLMAGGQTSLGRDVEASLRGLISQDAERGGLDDEQLMRRFESARELENKAFRSLMADARGELANRGLLGEPGSPSGAEGNTIRRITESIAPDFARNIRDIYSDLSEQADARLLQSIQLATGLSQQQASMIMAAAGEGTNRQQVLGQLALQSLEQNRLWNQFLAQYGLNRDQVLLAIEQGNTQQILGLINQFMQVLATSRAGYINED